MTSARAASADRLQPVLAGLVAALTGFFGSFAVLLAGLGAVGASPAQAASGLLALCVAQGALSIVLSWRTRIPLAFVWLTPGAALLIAAHRPGASFATAVGAFLLTGVLLVLIGALPVAARVIARIPTALTGALLAGVLLPFCLAPVTAAVRMPALALPLLAVWLVLTRFAARWAAAAVILLAIGLTIASGGVAGADVALPAPVLTAPRLDPALLLSVGVPLTIVTMAGQNLPGFAVLRSAGYRPPTRLVLLASGLATLATAPFGGHTVNLAAITGAITAGPEASADRARRWVATASSGAVYLLLALGAGAAAALVGSTPPLLIEAGAGLALLGALLGGLVSALEQPATRIPALVTFLVVASGVSVAGIGSAVWGLVAGAVVLLVLRRPQRPQLETTTER